MRLLLVLLVLASPVQAAEPTPFRWTQHETIPKRISDVGLASNVVLDAWDALYKSSARARWGFPCRILLTAAIVESTKRVIHRTRPNGDDRRSFPSGHAAFSTATAGHRQPLGASVALVVSWGREAGGMHYSTDLFAGVGVGLFARWICP